MNYIALNPTSFYSEDPKGLTLRQVFHHLASWLLQKLLCAENFKILISICNNHNTLCRCSIFINFHEVNFEIFQLFCIYLVFADRNVAVVYHIPFKVIHDLSLIHASKDFILLHLHHPDYEGMQDIFSI